METSAETFFVPAWSEETFLFDLDLHVKKFPNLYERILKMQALIGLKAYRVKSISEQILYTNEVADCLEPAGISLAFTH